VIAGSGISGAITGLLADPQRADAAELPGVPSVQVLGQSNHLTAGRVQGIPILVFGGRKHLYEQVPIHEVIFPILLLAELGADGVILTNAAGAVNPNFHVGQMMLIRDHIDSSFGQFADELWQVLQGFEPMGSSGCPYDVEWLSAAAAEARSQHVDCAEGIYCFNRGPFYETPAEVIACRHMGADAVGMSTVPEAIAAHALGLRVLAVSLLTNMATGMTSQAHSHDEITRQAAKAHRDIAQLLDSLLKHRLTGAAIDTADGFQTHNT